ncbi:MAG: hypothetical protein KA436_07400 [Oligoflexales bacterium]|nr:hypothetical protein [Oligoflexales bacterium]
MLVCKNFILLYRSKFFLPFLLLALLSFFLAHTISLWGVNELKKILYDLGGVFLLLIGHTGAMFWSVKLFSEARSEGACELELASPISRTNWYLSLYGGVIASLSLFGILLLLFWQALMLIYGYSWMKPSEWVLFLFPVLGWSVTAALALFFACFCSWGLALFSTFLTCLLGLLAAPTYQAISGLSTGPSESTGGLSEGFSLTLLSFFAKFWNLQNFHLAYTELTRLDVTAIAYTLIYAFGLIVFFLSLGILIFDRQDLT